MKSKAVLKNALERQLEVSAENLLEILEKDDGRTFEEKKAEIMENLINKSERLSEVNEEKEVFGVEIITKFWEQGEIGPSKIGIVLRRVKDVDKEKFL